MSVKWIKREEIGDWAERAHTSWPLFWIASPKSDLFLVADSPDCRPNLCRSAVDPPLLRTFGKRPDPPNSSCCYSGAALAEHSFSAASHTSRCAGCPSSEIVCCVLETVTASIQIWNGLHFIFKVSTISGSAKVFTVFPGGNCFVFGCRL